MPEKREKIDFERDIFGMISMETSDAIINYALKHRFSYRKSLSILQKLFQGGRTNVRDANNPATAEEVTSKHSHKPLSVMK